MEYRRAGTYPAMVEVPVVSVRSMNPESLARKAARGGWHEAGWLPKRRVQGGCAGLLSDNAVSPGTWAAIPRLLRQNEMKAYGAGPRALQQGKGGVSRWRAETVCSAPILLQAR